MDKTLFSSALLRLIADNSRFYFPGFGVICSEEYPAEIQDSGIILPPGRKVYIKESLETDEKLLEAYMNLSGKDRMTASAEIESYLREVRKSVFAKGSYVFEGAGTLRIDSEGVPCFDISDSECLSAEDFGFGKLALKVLKREVFVEDLSGKADSPEPEQLPEGTQDKPLAEHRNDVPEEDAKEDELQQEIPQEEPVEKIGQDMAAPVPEKESVGTEVPEEQPIRQVPENIESPVGGEVHEACQKKTKTWLVVLLVGLALIMFFFLLLIIFKDDIAASFTEMLYSQDELELIRRNRFSA